MTVDQQVELVDESRPTSNDDLNAEGSCSHDSSGDSSEETFEMVGMNTFNYPLALMRTRVTVLTLFVFPSSAGAIRQFNYLV